MRWARPFVLALAACILPAAPALAQDPAPLDRAASLLERGEYDAAREAVGDWLGDLEAGRVEAPANERARALLLRARLATSLEAAESDYVSVALAYPSSPHAAEALLRLGQGLLLAGRPDRASMYLERMTRDYPRDRRYAAAVLWLARAQRLAGDASAACRTVESGAAAAGEPGLARLLDDERAAACEGAVAGFAAPEVLATVPVADDPPRGDSAVAPAATGERPDSAEAARRGAGGADRADEVGDGDFAVQAGAFRRVEGAEALAARLREAGFEPRLVYIPDNRLLRVRLGRFTDPSSATALARRLEAAGFDSFVVSDAGAERGRSRRL